MRETMKILKLIPCLLLVVMLLGCDSETLVSPNNDTDQLTAVKSKPANGAANKSTKSTTDIFNTITGDVIGKSTLHRNKNGITINFKTTGLMPGHAYTLWWVVWNKPENCIIPGECAEADFPNAGNVEVQLLYATGSVAGNNGTGNFSAHLNENDDTGSIHELFGLPNFDGLQNAQTAEIHGVLRSHGPKIPGQVGDQITSYEGGCVVNFPAFTEIPDAPGECGDIIAALHRL
jgi:hypothetical protein